MSGRSDRQAGIPKTGGQQDTQAIAENKEAEETETSSGQPHIYDNAVVKDVINGSRTDKIGEYSVIEIASDMVTEEALNDWYFNYVEKNDFNWCMILYADSENYEGVWTNGALVETGVHFEQDEYGDYAMKDASTTSIYAPKNGVLKKLQVEAQETSEEDDADDGVPTEYKSALRSAEVYSDMMHMSKMGIYDQLTSEYGDKFTAEAAQYAIDNIQADWNANALASAESYSDTMHMSKAAIYDQLISEYGDKFEESEAQYAVDNIQADWNNNALESAKTYQDTMNMSPAAIRDQLVSEYGDKFTAEEADYAVANLE